MNSATVLLIKYLLAIILIAGKFEGKNFGGMVVSLCTCHLQSANLYQTVKFQSVALVTLGPTSKINFLQYFWV